MEYETTIWKWDKKKQLSDLSTTSEILNFIGNRKTNSIAT